MSTRPKTASCWIHIYFSSYVNICTISASVYYKVTWGKACFISYFTDFWIFFLAYLCHDSGRFFTNRTVSSVAVRFWLEARGYKLYCGESLEGILLYIVAFACYFCHCISIDWFGNIIFSFWLIPNWRNSLIYFSHVWGNNEFFEFKFMIYDSTRCGKHFISSGWLGYYSLTQTTHVVNS